MDLPIIYSLRCQTSTLSPFRRIFYFPAHLLLCAAAWRALSLVARGEGGSSASLKHCRANENITSYQLGNALLRCSKKKWGGDCKPTTHAHYLPVSSCCCSTAKHNSVAGIDKLSFTMGHVMAITLRL